VEANHQFQFQGAGLCNLTIRLLNLCASTLLVHCSFLSLFSGNQISAIIGKTVPRVHTSQTHITFKGLLYSDVRIDQASNND
jgi:uncharacterized MnhB-related membrane protein